MFNTIKDKLLNTVPFLAGEDSQNQSPKPKINVQAGCRILQHWEQQWEQLHSLNETNAQNAEKCAKDIENIAEKISTTKMNIDLIRHIFEESNFTKNIKTCLATVEDMQNVCRSLEMKLDNLKQLNQDIEIQKQMKRMDVEFEQFKLEKLERLERLKSTMETEHQRAMLEREQQKKQRLEERQKVFQEAFKEDLNTYKELGTIPKVELSNRQNGAILEEIQLDYDQDELEQFFKEDNPKS